jgi:hypothetical protein
MNKWLYIYIYRTNKQANECNAMFNAMFNAIFNAIFYDIFNDMFNAWDCGKRLPLSFHMLALASWAPIFAFVSHVGFGFMGSNFRFRFTCWLSLHGLQFSLSFHMLAFVYTISLSFHMSALVSLVSLGLMGFSFRGPVGLPLSDRQLLWAHRHHALHGPAQGHPHPRLEDPAHTPAPAAAQPLCPGGTLPNQSQPLNRNILPGKPITDPRQEYPTPPDQSQPLNGNIQHCPTVRWLFVRISYVASFANTTPGV